MDGFAVYTIVVAALFVFAVFAYKTGLLKRTKSPFLVIATVLLITGFFLVQSKFDMFIKAANVRSWPTVTGVINSSQVIGQRAARPEIVYKYIVEGDTLTGISTGQLPSFGGRGSKRSAAEKVSKLFVPGSELTVYYDVENPTNSSLSTLIPTEVLLQLGFGFFLLLSSLVFVIIYFKSK